MVVFNWLGLIVEKCSFDQEHKTMVRTAKLWIHGIYGGKVRGFSWEEDIQSISSWQDHKDYQSVDRRWCGIVRD